MRIWIVMLFACACGKGEEAAKPAGSGSAAPPPPAVTADAAPAPAPQLSPKIEAARCGEPCLFLVDTPFDKFLDTYKAKCGGMETKELGFEDCKSLDYVRNCIYAAHGVTYKKKKWKNLFAKKPWYEPHDGIDVKHVLSPVELANVHELNTRGKACKKGIKVSTADAKLVKDWLAPWPTTPPKLPKALFHNSDPLEADNFAEAFANDVGRDKIKLGGDNMLFYETGDSVPEGIRSLPGKVRFIEAVLGGDYQSTLIYFAFDDKDKLVGLEFEEVEDGE